MSQKKALQLVKGLFTISLFYIEIGKLGQAIIVICYRKKRPN